MKSALIGMTIMGIAAPIFMLGSAALAIDLNASAGVGGVSIGAEAGMGGGAVSAQGSVGAGAAHGSASAAASTGSGPSIEGGAELGGGQGSVEAGVSANAGGAAAGLNVQPGATPAPPPENQPPAATPPQSDNVALALPAALTLDYPCGESESQRCDVSSAEDDSIDARTPEYLQAIVAVAVQASAPLAMVTACRNGIVEGAMPHNPVRVDAVSAGDVRQLENGDRVAPLVVRIVYDRDGGYEVREAPIDCLVDASGAVISFSG